MTAQFPDGISFLDEGYALGRLSNGPLFSPEDWGMEAISDCTALRKGFRADYAIIDETLFMTRLFITSDDGLYPEIQGVTPDGNVYEGLKLKITYTGKIRLLKDFDRKYYMHQGLQVAAGHHTVLDLTLEKGELIDVCDRSEEAKFLRAEYEKKHDRAPLTFLHNGMDDFRKLYMDFI